MIRAFCIIALVLELTSSIERQPTWYTPIPTDDYQRCPQTIHVMEVLPGMGFDNLNNREMGQVLAVNFSHCSATTDGQYLIPDDVCAVPIKTSQVHLYSELIDHWQNYSSSTSRSININAGLHLMFGGISGSFSYEHESVKKHMVEDKSVTIRTQLRHVLYSVQSQPDSKLHERCKARLLEIASYIQTNDTYQATYHSQLFVRDFGTHVTSRVEAGAIISQVDQINSNFVETYNEDKSKITASASASFFGVFSIGGDYTSTTDQKSIDEYKKNRRKSTIETIGGPPYRANYTLNQWEDGLGNALVPIDRDGDPIWYVITESALPELPVDTVQILGDSIKTAVEQYYLHNVHRGCTNGNAKNFNPQANFNDGQCEPPNTNYTFGGVFQTCTGEDDFCSHNQQVNPKTREFSCPKPYEAQLLYSFNGPRHCVQHCSGFFIFRSCDWSCTQGLVHAYWCYARSAVPKDSGYLFGGVYTDNTVNLITQEKKCPKMFYPLRIVEGYVCVSDDYELGYRYSYPFGGFISCDYGNPLSESTDVKLRARPNSLHSFFSTKGGCPKHCPKGYSQHLMQISHGCEINYCVQKNALSDMAVTPRLNRPPFVTKPVPVNNNTMYLLTRGKTVLKQTSDLKWKEIRPMDTLRMSQSPQLHQSNQSGISLGGTVALTMFGTIVAALVIWIAVLLIARARKRPYERRVEAPTAIYTCEDASRSEIVMDTETSRLVA